MPLPRSLPVRTPPLRTPAAQIPTSARSSEHFDHRRSITNRRVHDDAAFEAVFARFDELAGKCLRCLLGHGPRRPNECLLT